MKIRHHAQLFKKIPWFFSILDFSNLKKIFSFFEIEKFQIFSDFWKKSQNPKIEFSLKFVWKFDFRILRLFSKIRKKPKILDFKKWKWFLSFEKSRIEKFPWDFFLKLRMMIKFLFIESPVTGNAGRRRYLKICICLRICITSTYFLYQLRGQTQV